jgi:hypothetical protein
VEIPLESSLKLLPKSLWLLFRACEWKMEDDKLVKRAFAEILIYVVELQQQTQDHEGSLKNVRSLTEPLPL